MASAPPHASLAELVYSVSHCFPVENVMVLDLSTALPWRHAVRTLLQKLKMTAVVRTPLSSLVFAEPPTLL